MLCYRMLPDYYGYKKQMLIIHTSSKKEANVFNEELSITPFFSSKWLV